MAARARASVCSRWSPALLAVAAVAGASPRTPSSLSVNHLLLRVRRKRARRCLRRKPARRWARFCFREYDIYLWRR